VKTERIVERRGEGRRRRRRRRGRQRQKRREELRGKEERHDGGGGATGTGGLFYILASAVPDSQPISDCSGSLSGQRDISDFVRNLTGLELTELPP
jgi:hypothetical protein